MKKANRILALGLCLILVGGVFDLFGGGTKEQSKPKKVEVAFIPPGMVSPFYAGTIEGAKKAATEFGFELLILSPERENDYAGLLKIAEDMITRKVAAIAMCSIDTETTVAAVKKANAAGIPVILFNTLVKIPAGDVYAYVGYDQRAAGRSVAEYILTKYPGKQINAVIIEGLPSSFTTERAGGFMDVLKEKKPANVKVVASQPGDWEREKSMNVASNLLQAYPEINMFYGLSDEMALGAAQACKAKGKTDVIIIGIDGNPNALNAVAVGDITATVNVKPPLIGYKAIEAVKEVQIAAGLVRPVARMRPLVVVMSGTAGEDS
jgi:ribose transport system substrate-binding protein